MNARFDFKAKGYLSAGDWSRLWDLLPKADVTDNQRLCREAYRSGGEPKSLLLRLLRSHGVVPELYDAEKARTRNTVAADATAQ